MIDLIMRIILATPSTLIRDCHCIRHGVFSESVASRGDYPKTQSDRSGTASHSAAFYSGSPAAPLKVTWVSR